MAIHLVRRLEPLKSRYAAILCPLRGGFYLSDFVSRRLNLPVEYMHLTSYQGHESGNFVVYFKPALQPGNRYLICDDILATGRTMAKIQELYPESSFDGAFLYRHRQRSLPFETTLFAREIDASVWVHFPWEDDSAEF
jgi:adenine/guanine phosphoribosyltransferase-like PRPP-binding protein